MRKAIQLILALLLAAPLFAQPTNHDLRFDTLAARWDEAIPLGNGILGALVWQRAGNLRFSLDRADLWDLRPTKGLHRPEFRYQWVIDQVRKKDYTPVQQYFDKPYDQEPAPSKIPGGAIEFDTKDWGKPRSVRLYIQNALNEVRWANGVVMTSFVHATAPIGWFRFEHLPPDAAPKFAPKFFAPKYQAEEKAPAGDDLSRLGYPPGTTTQQTNAITYSQQGWGGFSYEISIRWRQVDATTIEGDWSISSNYPTARSTDSPNTKPAGSPAAKPANSASTLTQRAIARHFSNDLATHAVWWRGFWSQSAIHVPDTLIDRQWWLEQYKFGSASRRGAPPISLQAIWTADNGKLPPWKGDYHHDLNTELSYWPCYSSNHLQEGLAFLDHLDRNKANYERYTRQYFGCGGLAVPGVTTLDGTEMGGWIQYSLSPATSSWLAQHYYLQWRYCMNRNFLQQRAYPWIKAVAEFLQQVTVMDSTGHRKLPISSSPEINDNDITAWFPQNTNFDLSLMRFTFQAAAELAAELGLPEQAAHWKEIVKQFGDFAVSPAGELMIAPSMAYNQSHRHFSHLMAIYPLGLIKWEDGPSAQSIIVNSIRQLDSIGPANWCGYSYAWLANLKARAKNGEGAANDLSIFARAFCSINSFHLNGDQTKSGYSNYQYRPFTLEGNFAFAAGLQEMLLQSYAGFIEIMPAVPAAWKELSFDRLRAQGAWLVNARRTGGLVDEVKLVSEAGGTTKLKLPFHTWFVKYQKGMTITNTGDGFITLTGKPGSFIVLKNSYE